MRLLFVSVLFLVYTSTILVAQTKICPLLFSSVENTEFKKNPTENPEAHEAYLKGWSSFWKQPDLGWRQAIRYFKKAIELDPDFTMAYVGLSWSYDELCRKRNEYCAEYRETVEKTVEMGDALPEVHTLRGYLLAFSDRDWVAAEKEFKKAQELDSNFSSIIFAVYLLGMGRREEALAEAVRWVQQTDPQSAGEQSEAVYLYYITRKYDLALEKINRVRELDSDRSSVGWYEWLCYQGKALEEETFKAFLSMRRKLDNAEEMEKYKQVFRESGMQRVYRLRLDDFMEENSDKPFDVAGVYALAGEKDLAFEWLNKARGPLFVSDARFDSLRNDPRYEQHLRKLNLPEDAIQRHLALPVP